MGSAGKVGCWFAVATSIVCAGTIDGELLGLTRGDSGQWAGQVSIRVAGKVEKFQMQYDFKRSNWSEERCWIVGTRWRFTFDGHRIISIRCGSVDWVLHNQAVATSKVARAMLLAIRTGRRDRAQALLPAGFVLKDSVWESWRTKLDSEVFRPIPPEHGNARCVIYLPAPEESIASPRAGCLDSGWPYSEHVGFTIQRERGAIRLVPDFNWPW